MAKLKIVYRKTDELIPYENNPRINDKAVDAVAASIKEFGFNVPIVIDADSVIVAGHTRLEAAKILQLSEVPTVSVDSLTDEQIRAYRLADNKTAELAQWDWSKLQEEMDALKDVDMSVFGFFRKDWFDREINDADSYQNGNDDYNDFIDKFKPKKTTDDCYTPAEVYDAVADWVAKEYKVDRKDFVRPFYPGGDYQRENYKITDIVVDNPPFSILSKIIHFYAENKIKFFLFAPHLTLFSPSSFVCSIGVGVNVMYENGAKVETSFLTNLDDCRFRSAPTLYQAVKEAVEATKNVVELPKYVYPDEVVTSSILDRFSKYGIDYKVGVESSEFIRELDEQKEEGKAIYGSGYLISEKAAAEKAAAEKAAAEKAAAEKAAATVWELSEREREIISQLK